MATAKPAQLFTVPRREQYLEVLPGLWRNGLPQGHKLMLEHHFKAPNRTTTATRLAKAADYAGYQAANRWYSDLGKRIGVAIGMTFDTYLKNGEIKDVPASAIGIWVPDPFQKGGRMCSNGEWQIIMHHNVADALRELNLWED